MLVEAPIEAIWQLHAHSEPNWVRKTEDAVLRDFERNLRSREFPRIYGYEGRFHWNESIVLEYYNKHTPEVESTDDLTSLPSSNEVETLDRPHEAPLEELPETPPAMWPGRPAGRPKAADRGILLDFIEATYGRYLPAHKDDLRDYIFKNDNKLYRAIERFEERDKLPPDLAMTTRPERVLTLVQNAAARGTKHLSKSERRSVIGKAVRTARNTPQA